MSNIAASFASLVKFNNGFFKSEKQADFLLQMVSEGLNVSAGSVYNNSFILTYICDNKGVTRVEKYTFTSGNTVTTWERVEEGKVSIQNQKQIKKFKRELKVLKQDIKEREDEMAAIKNGTSTLDFSIYSEEETIELFERTNSERYAKIEDIEQSLSKL